MSYPRFYPTEMNYQRMLKAALLLQQRSSNHIGVMEKDGKHLYQYDNTKQNALRHPSKAYTELEWLAKTEYSGIRVSDAPDISELENFSIVEIKDTFRFWEVLGFMSTQEIDSRHDMQLEARHGFSFYKWNGLTLGKSLNDPITHAYQICTFRWDHPIVEISDVTAIALAELAT